MRRILAVLALMALFVVIGSTSAFAHPGHASCKAFGQHNTEEARAGIIDDEIRSFGPGNVDDVVELVHLGGQFGDITVPALCLTS